MKQEQKYFLFESGILLMNMALEEGKITTNVATDIPMITPHRASVVKHPPKDTSMDFKH